MVLCKIRGWAVAIADERGRQLDSVPIAKLNSARTGLSSKRNR